MLLYNKPLQLACQFQYSILRGTGSDYTGIVIAMALSLELVIICKVSDESLLAFVSLARVMESKLTSFGAADK